MLARILVRSRLSILLASATFAGLAASSHAPLAHEDDVLARQLQAIAAAHHGGFALYAHNLRTGQTVSVSPDLPVKTASTIKLGILLDAAEQIRAGNATLAEKLVLNRENQVEGSGILAQLTPPLALTLGDTLSLMVILSDNTATNMAIDRLGLAHINATLRAAGSEQTVLYKKVYVPATSPMPLDQPRFGLGKTTPREMAAILERLATCRLALGSSVALPGDGPLCGKLLAMLRNQQDRNMLPRYLETLDTSENGSAIADKIGTLDAVRNDVALIATKAGPIVISAFTFDNEDQRWNPDNEGEITLAKAAQMIVQSWSPAGLDPKGFPWENPLGVH
jgi:beta-lactamase class A